MRRVFLAASLGLLIASPVSSQPIIIPLSPQPQRQPPPPPPASPVPIAPGQQAGGSSGAEQSGGDRPTVEFDNANKQTPGSAASSSGGQQ